MNFLISNSHYLSQYSSQLVDKSTAKTFKNSSIQKIENTN
ncbi:hypothetical protein LEP1GSC133_3024 [Leptospira borgpetersenii serovar Pomona str. 200901868]|uniref:Uncharacterized protein n=1 Tax=Leptospira borgpetersenii serovar Pomona str. 200901868 TaxID=1192866 RepID=M6WAW5_LEPBO|nr:hypothetical protein LEP1GSC133_3024 [Leptospira borgpetersenii serovar Pomona str. 200901868]